MNGRRARLTTVGSESLPTYPHRFGLARGPSVPEIRAPAARIDNLGPWVTGARPYRTLLIFSGIVALSTGCRGRKEHLVDTSARGGRVAVPTSDPGLRGGAPSASESIVDKGPVMVPPCPTIDRSKVAPFEVDRSAIKAAVPPIV